MAAIRIIDDHLELANIGTNSHAQIDTHIAAADDYVKRDGSLALTSDWDIGDTRKIHTDEIRARDAAGLKLYDDGGNGLFVADGGKVGAGTATPAGDFHLKGASNVDLRCESATDAYNSIISTLATGKAQFRLATNNYFRWAIGVDGSAGNKCVFAWGHSVGLNQRMVILSTGEVGLSTISPTALIDINSDILRLRTAKTPATAGAAGNTGDVCADANYFYRCVSTNSWKRAALNVW